MIKKLFLLVFFLYASQLFSQELRGNTRTSDQLDSDDEKPKFKSLRGTGKKDTIATIDQYRIITLSRDTTYVDTSLTIKNEYRFNYLRKDLFGYLPFSNEGQPYTALQHHSSHQAAYPGMGFNGKNTAWLKPEDIRYYSVATPFSDLYYKSVMQQGQNVDAFVTANINPQFNFSIAYKGLRSLGEYINQLTSHGSFRFTSSYRAKGGRYYANAHMVSHDFANGENGGLINVGDFESEDPRYDNRARLNVYFRDARSFFRGKRFFLDHAFRINKSDAQNNLFITHQFNYERKMHEFKQTTLNTTLDNNTQMRRLGDSYTNSGITDQTRYNRLYNRVGAAYENKTLGKFHFFIEDFRYNFYFGRILVIDQVVIPGAISDEIQNIGGQYEYRKNKWQGNFMLMNSITNQSLSTADAKLSYTFNEKNKLSMQYQRLNKLPDHLYNLHQSSYIAYNWSNDFNNEKINNIFFKANTQWLTAELQLSNYKDLLYFSNDDLTNVQQLVTPKQESENIRYLSVKVGREFKWWKLALDNTFLYQKVDQKNPVLNLPEFVTRNTLYFSDHYFKKALYIQTGVTANYFTSYYINDYSPVLGEFFVQDQKQVGSFPMFDFFINARIKTARLFFKCEHFNASWTGNDYLNAPNYPYRDFTLRFGIEWNFFK